MMQHAPRLYATLQQLAQQRVVFFAGLPGTGKSFLSHQLAHLAHSQQRLVHLLQWDTARPVFEASATGQRYPGRDGVTHAVIRKAVGLWARQALVQWQHQYPEARHLLIGETPLIGHRFLALAAPATDTAEALLRTACFILPVPSRAVRLFLEAERQRRHRHPVHPQEREDAPPTVLQALWRELVVVAEALGFTAPAAVLPATLPYDPVLYQRVYTHLLRYRARRVMALDTLLPTAAFSVYDYAIARHELKPTAQEVERYIAAVEQQYPEADVLQHEIAHWYILPQPGARGTEHGLPAH
ncbi:MAG: hypothetical protein AB7N91_18840 [Candidatus Tectimicrobiota bacterium]